MHDTFLNQNLYESIVNLCKEHSISKIYTLILTVHTHSHISAQSIREHFVDRNNTLIDLDSNIIIQKEERQPLTATIEQIDGE